MKSEDTGYWIPVLHCHLPFIKHPEYEYFLEEQWLFEAISESYIPLLMNMRRMTREGIDFRLTVSISPPLLEMSSDAHLMEKYLTYLDRLIDLSGRELNRLKEDRDFLPLASFYRKRYKEIKSFFSDTLSGNILNGFRSLRDQGSIEIITSGATHGFLPFLNNNPRAVEAQVSVAMDTFVKHFGDPAEGIWLPECAYYEGLDNILKKFDFKYFFLDSQGLMNGKPVPRYGVYAPVFTKNGVAVFARDPLSSAQVWSAEHGYPGDPWYRDFYRDAGYDLEHDYIKPFISPDGTRVFTGIKYHRITGGEGGEEPYDPAAAETKVKEHAAHFCSERIRQLELLSAEMDRPAMVLSPYDAELFGHWWFEGPDFLLHVFSEMDRTAQIKTLTPSEYLGMFPKNQVVLPCPTSWGDKGYYDTWLNGENDWMYRHLHMMADMMVDLADTYHEETDRTKVRLLTQMARELLLAQSSDWAFLMTTNTAREYSTRRIEEHVSNFNALRESLISDSLDMKLLESLEQKNSIFSDLDFRVFAGDFD
jgi:1,4-alpha-glucan branching enzyme